MTVAAQSGFAHLALVFCCRDQNSDEIKATAHFSAEQVICTTQKTITLTRDIFFSSKINFISFLWWDGFPVPLLPAGPRVSFQVPLEQTHKSSPPGDNLSLIHI